MLNKFINLFIWDKRIGAKIMLIIIIAFGSVLLWNKEKMLVVQLKELKQNQQFTAQIPALERQLSIQDSLKKLELKNSQMNGLALKGIFLQNNNYCALIGDKVYQKQDYIGDFQVSDIGLDYVILQDKNTKQTITLRFAD